MTKTMRVIPVLMLAALMLAQPVSALQTSVVTDPVGDLSYSKHLAYRDIVKAEIAKQGRTFFFSMEMAGPIPETPDFASGGTAFMSWGWGLDTNSKTFPAGFPFPPEGAPPAEYLVIILWDGTRFTGLLIDRTPLLTGGEAKVTLLAFTIEGAELKTSVDKAMVGDPSAFLWNARTSDPKTPWPSGKIAFVDIAPETGTVGGHCCFAPWPS